MPRSHHVFRAGNVRTRCFTPFLNRTTMDPQMESGQNGRTEGQADCTYVHKDNSSGRILCGMLGIISCSSRYKANVKVR
jgi:Zn-finger protein